MCWGILGCILDLFVFVYRPHMPHTACRPCVWLFLPVLIVFIYFYLHAFFAAPVCDDPCTVLNASQRVQKAAKIKKKAVCKKIKTDREENAFFTIRSIYVCSSFMYLS